MKSIRFLYRRGKKRIDIELVAFKSVHLVHFLDRILLIIKYLV